MESDLWKIIEALKGVRSVAILSHVNPEGDTLGSALGCHLTLKAMGKDVATFNPDPIPKNLRDLPEVEEVICANRLPRPFEGYLVVDAADSRRVGGLLNGLPTGSLVMNIDHHPTNARFGTYNWVDPEASSTGEMIHHLFKVMEVPLSPEAATNLYVAILTDTGSFQFANTTPRALRAAAELIEAGVVPQAVTEMLFGRRDLAEFHLLGALLTRMQVSPDGAFAWMEVTDAMLKDQGLDMDALEGFINYPRSLRGIEVALLFKEVAGNGVKVSLRSRGKVDVAKIALAFQGGGHKNAAGCTVLGSMADVRERVLAALQRALQGAKG
jgi:phosphoesterase RecJ-like protein